MKDYVHVKDAGKGTFVYVIDTGVQIEVKNSDNEYEFKTENGKVLQARKSRNAGQDLKTDEQNDSHGTKVASKAVGKIHGVAKEATLISVKVLKKGTEFTHAINLIIGDINANPGRAEKSVVVCSLGYGGKVTPEKAAGQHIIDVFKTPLLALFDLGVPFVASAGNHALETDRDWIDNLPKIHEDLDPPIINVGSAKVPDGSRRETSQAGPHLNIYAPGASVQAQTKVDGPGEVTGGTSYAAPAVAGVIATYLSYDQPPWDGSKTGKERVQAIKDYIRSDESSWVRKPGSDVRIIWNGAKKSDHDSVGANNCGSSKKRGDCPNPPSSQPPPSATPSPPPPPPPKTKAISIILQNYIDEISNTNTWLFFNIDVGVSALCHQDKEAKSFPAPGDSSIIDNPPWPGGTFPIYANGDCEYKNNGENPGSLWCGESEIVCQQDDLRWSGEGKECDKGLWAITQHPVVLCEW